MIGLKNLLRWMNEGDLRFRILDLRLFCQRIPRINVNNNFFDLVFRQD